MTRNTPVIGARNWRKRLVLIGLGMLAGLIVATVGVAVYPSLGKTALMLVCDAQTPLESPAPRNGLEQIAPIRPISCASPFDGSQREVSGMLVAVSTVIYGAALSVLFVLLGMPRVSVGARRDASTVTPTIAASQNDVDRLTGKIPHRATTSTRTFVTVNGQSVDSDVAADVSRLLQHIAQSDRKSFVSGSSEHDMQAIFSKIAHGQYQTTRSSQRLDEQLQQLKHLHAQRLITGAEYASKKADLLSRL